MASSPRQGGIRECERNKEALAAETSGKHSLCARQQFEGPSPSDQVKTWAYHLITTLPLTVLV